MSRDLEHLRLLSIFHYVVAAMVACFSLIPLVHLAIGIAMVTGALEGDRDNPPPPIVGWILIGIAGTIILCGLIAAALIAFAGRSLARQRRYLYCCVVAGISCIFMPFGTALGIFTFIVLMRDSVRHLFGEPVAGPD